MAMFIFIFNFMPAPASGQDEAHNAFLINSKLPISLKHGLPLSSKTLKLIYTTG